MAYPYVPGYGYAIPPPPPPPQNAPNMTDLVYEIEVPPPPSPTGSPPGRGGTKSPYVVYGGSDGRGKQYYDDPSSRLAVGRSSSTKEHRRAASVHVGDSRRDRSRPRSTYHSGGGRYEDEFRGREDTVYYGRGDYYAGSAYSASSHGSRDNSRDRYGHGGNRHHRTPSAHSDAGYDTYAAPYPPGPPPQGQWGPAVPPPPPMMNHMAMTLVGPGGPPHPGHHPNQPLMAPGPMVPWHGGPPQPQQISPEQEELNKKIEQLQAELKKSKEESEKIQKSKEQAEEEKKKREELTAAVQREIDARTAALKKAADEAAAEKARIEAEAKRLLEAQKAAEAAAAAAKAAREAEDKARVDAAVEARLAVEQQKNNMMLDLRKPTHTKFSKTHLCKEALDERKISYTEHEDSFLVHRWVDRDEQNALWARTKQIRAYQLEYQKRFKEEADKAPVIDTPNGPVKIVRVGNNPPVTVPVVLVTKKAPVAPTADEVKFRHIFGR